jgi:16S rRNA (uracil1498-N3)-methyltransferase
MTARVRIPVSDLAPGERLLDERGSRHLAVVLRLGAGDAFVAFDPERGVEADGRIARVHGGKVHAELGTTRPAKVSAPLPVTWIQGLAKGDKMDAIVRDATELGATRVVPAATARAVVRLEGARAEQRRRRWTRIAEEAARQCGRADPPAVECPMPWRDALRLASAGACFCLYEAAEEPLGPILASSLRSEAAFAFAAGPEGGLTYGEVEEARAVGFHVVSLGDLVLRTETVASCVLGALGILRQTV